MARHAIGIDFGTNSVRAVVVDCETGDEVGSALHRYEHGDEGIILDPKRRFDQRWSYAPQTRSTRSHEVRASHRNPARH